MKRWRSIIILGLILAVLLSAYFLLKGKETAADPDSSATGASEENPDTVSLIDIERDDVVEIVLNHEGEKMVLIREDREVEVEIEQDDGTVETTTRTEKVWISDDMELEQSVVNNILYGGANANTKRLIESDPEDLSVYGLDKPFSVTFKDASGKSQTIEVGNSTPTGDHYYAKKGNEKAVYTLTRYTAECLTPGKYKLAARQLYHKSGLTVDDITDLTFYRNDELVFSAHLMEPPALWVITEPLEINADYQDLYSFLTGLSQLKAVAVVDENPANLENYGLDKPKYVMSYILDGESYELKVGHREGSEYYAMMEGKGYVYTLSAENLAFLDKPLAEVVQMLVYVPSIFDTSRLVIELDGRTDVLEMDITPEHAEDDVYLFNGQKIEGDDNRSLFRRYFQGAIALSGSRLVLDANPEGEPAVRLTYTAKDSSEETVIELIPTPDDYGYYAMKNGRYTGLVLGKRELDKDNMGIRKSYENLINGLNK